MSSIQIIKQYPFHGSVLFGLLVDGAVDAFPLLVGCSLRPRLGEIVDLKARWLVSPGRALWKVQADSRFRESGTNVSPMDSDWEGQIIFALYSDESFNERLADTGWVSWYAPWLIGSSAKGLDYMEEEIESSFAGRFDVWKYIDE